MHVSAGVVGHDSEGAGAPERPHRRGASSPTARLHADKLSFSRETKAVILFEGLVDWAEWGRKMGSSAYALATAATSVYPA